MHIHVGDVGTLYRIPIKASDIPGDPSNATLREILFLMPQGTITKNLDAATPPIGEVASDGTPAKRWFFSYTVQDNDGIGSPDDFHAEEGDISVQVHLAWADGREWSSVVFTGEVDGLTLHVYPNL